MILREDGLRTGLPDDRVTADAVSLAFDLDPADANLGAGLRAFERMQGH